MWSILHECYKREEGEKQTIKDRSKQKQQKYQINTRLIQNDNNIGWKLFEILSKNFYSSTGQMLFLLLCSRSLLFHLEQEIESKGQKNKNSKICLASDDGKFCCCFVLLVLLLDLATKKCIENFLSSFVHTSSLSFAFARNPENGLCNGEQNVSDVFLLFELFHLNYTFYPNGFSLSAREKLYGFLHILIYFRNSPLPPSPTENGCRQNKTKTHSDRPKISWC